MATLPKLYATGVATNPTTDWGVNGSNWTDIDEGISSADGVEVGDDTNSSISKYAYYTLTNMPSDFGSMGSNLTITCRSRVTGAQTNTRTLY